jgi:hypothetical protein
MRGSEAKVWTLGQNTWDLSARPNLPSDLLITYQQADNLPKTRNLTDAVNRWMARLEGLRPNCSSLPSWFLFRAAQVLADARHWTGSDGVYHRIQQGEPTLAWENQNKGGNNYNPFDDITQQRKQSEVFPQGIHKVLL